jgi:hypothetical protein
MYSSMARLLELLANQPHDSTVIGWAGPVPFFGELSTAKVATVGINPSNLEFVTNGGAELDEKARRLHTLNSLGISSWDAAEGAHVGALIRECEGYFSRNPYRRWFDVLERSMAPSGYSYYPSGENRMCHVDLVPFATSEKWGYLTPIYRRMLVDQGRVAMAEFIRESPLEFLILNGRSVVAEFEAFAGIQLDAVMKDEWSLPRRDGSQVDGVLYTGLIDQLGSIEFERPVQVIGYNHNLQSSFGVTTAAMRAIGEYVGDEIASATAYPAC